MTRSPATVESRRAAVMMNAQSFALLVVCGSLTGCSDPADPAAAVPVIRWEVPAPPSSVIPLALDSTVVFAGSGQVQALRKSTGELVWTQSIPSSFDYGLTSSIQLAGGSLIVAYPIVVALDPRTGSVLWQYSGPDRGAGTNNPAVAGDTIFTASELGWAAALDARTGRSYWTVDLKAVVGTPAVTRDLVIYGTRGFFETAPQGRPGDLIALRRTDGAEVWRFPLPRVTSLHGGSESGGAVWQDRVVVGGNGGRVYAVRLSDGMEFWERQATGATSQVVAYEVKPVVIGDVVVFVSSDNNIVGVNPRTGEQVWLRDHSAQTSRPQVVGQYLYTVGGFITIGTANGAVLWRYGGMSLGGGVGYSLGIADADGTIYAFGIRGRGETASYFAIDPPIRP